MHSIVPDLRKAERVALRSAGCHRRVWQQRGPAARAAAEARDRAAWRHHPRPGPLWRSDGRPRPPRRHLSSATATSAGEQPPENTAWHRIMCWLPRTAHIIFLYSRLNINCICYCKEYLSDAKKIANMSCHAGSCRAICSRAEGP